ncbi:ComEC/Rec2-related protein [Catenulispora sp. GP43]|uniref:ComEC/Rec2 family competence protein n=1 Tax=Catenulispora sp. GP43 TaxID=3156263 RepID=UPI0035130E4C
MSLTVTFRSVEPDRHSRRDLRLVPILLAAYGAAFVGDGFVSPMALLLWAGCALAGLSLLLRSGIRRHEYLRVGQAFAATRSSSTSTRTRTRRRTLAAACFVAAGAGTAATTRTIATHTGPLPRLAAAHAQATVEAVVTDDPHTATSAHGPFAVVPLRIERVNAFRTRLPATALASDPGAWQFLPSTRVRVTGRLRPAHDDSPDAAALSVHRPPDVLAGPNALQKLAGRLRQALRDACAHLPADPRGLVPGLVIGDVSQEPDSLSAAFRDTGLTHLTAVSGENLVFVLTAAMPIARFAGVRGRFLTLTGLAVVIGFTVLARPEPSMVRASVMAVLGLLLAAVGRRARGLPLLCAGGTLLLLFDPWLARSYGFALSLAATAGLFVLAPGWQQALIDRRVPHRIAESLACTAAAEAFCLPILVSFTAAITPLSLPANLLAEFCVGPATVLGAVALLAASVWLPLGHAVAWLAQWPADGIVAVARYGSRLPGATVGWPDGLPGTLALLAVYALVFLISAAAAKRKEELS